MVVRAMRTCPVCKVLKETKYLSNTRYGSKYGDFICKDCLKTLKAEKAEKEAGVLREAGEV